MRLRFRSAFVFCALLILGTLDAHAQERPEGLPEIVWRVIQPQMQHDGITLRMALRANLGLNQFYHAQEREAFRFWTDLAVRDPTLRTEIAEVAELYLHADSYLGSEVQIDALNWMRGHAPRNLFATVRALSLIEQHPSGNIDDAFWERAEIAGWSYLSQKENPLDVEDRRLGLSETVRQAWRETVFRAAENVLMRVARGGVVPLFLRRSVLGVLEAAPANQAFPASLEWVLREISRSATLPDSVRAELATLALVRERLLPTAFLVRILREGLSELQLRQNAARTLLAKLRGTNAPARRAIEPRLWIEVEQALRVFLSREGTFIAADLAVEVASVLSERHQGEFAFQVWTSGRNTPIFSALFAQDATDDQPARQDESVMIIDSDTWRAKLREYLRNTDDSTRSRFVQAIASSDTLTRYFSGLSLPERDAFLAAVTREERRELSLVDFRRSVDQQHVATPDGLRLLAAIHRLSPAVAIRAMQTSPAAPLGTFSAFQIPETPETRSAWQSRLQGASDPELRTYVNSILGVPGLWGNTAIGELFGRMMRVDPVTALPLLQRADVLPFVPESWEQDLVAALTRNRLSLENILNSATGLTRVPTQLWSHVQSLPENDPSDWREWLLLQWRVDAGERWAQLQPDVVRYLGDGMAFSATQGIRLAAGYVVRHSPLPEAEAESIANVIARIPGYMRNDGIPSGDNLLRRLLRAMPVDRTTTVRDPRRLSPIDVMAEIQHELDRPIAGISLAEVAERLTRLDRLDERARRAGRLASLPEFGDRLVALTNRMFAVDDLVTRLLSPWRLVQIQTLRAIHRRQPPLTPELVEAIIATRLKLGDLPDQQFVAQFVAARVADSHPVPTERDPQAIAYIRMLDEPLYEFWAPAARRVQELVDYGMGRIGRDNSGSTLEERLSPSELMLVLKFKQVVSQAIAQNPMLGVGTATRNQLNSALRAFQGFTGSASVTTPAIRNPMYDAPSAHRRIGTLMTSRVFTRDAVDLVMELAMDHPSHAGVIAASQRYFADAARYSPNCVLQKVTTTLVRAQVAADR